MSFTVAVVCVVYVKLVFKVTLVILVQKWLEEREV